MAKNHGLISIRHPSDVKVSGHCLTHLPLEKKKKKMAHLVSRVSRPQFCWGLAILCDPPFFSGYIEFGGVVVKFYPSVEITLYLLADFLLQYVTLFQSRDIVKNLVSL